MASPTRGDATAVRGQHGAHGSGLRKDALPGIGLPGAVRCDLQPDLSQRGQRVFLWVFLWLIYRKSMGYLWEVKTI